VDLRVVEPRERARVTRRQALVVEQHPGDDDRPGQAPATGFVGAGDIASAEGAIEPE
jgi:hypothetical protein